MSHEAREGKAPLTAREAIAPPIIVAAGVLIEDGRVLLSQRKTGTHLAGAWEFPGGKVEPGEDPRAALVRELEEELGIQCEVGAPVEVTFHAYPPDPSTSGRAKSVLLLFFLARRTATSAEPRPIDVADVRWALPSELDPAAFPPADVAVLARVRLLLNG